MENEVFRGIITAKEEFLYPDSDLAVLPDKLVVTSAKNGMRSIQILLEAEGEAVTITTHTNNCFDTELYEMVDIPVEYNTGNGVEQGGSMVLLNQPKEKPVYCTRKAPFRVYDCLKPSKESVPVKNGIAAAYLCFVPKKGTSAGQHKIMLAATGKNLNYICTIVVNVYDVEIPAETFPVTNWFSLDAICRFHHTEYDTPAFYKMAAKYAVAMRRARQTHFFLQLDTHCVVSRNPWKFDFSYLEKIIRVFFDAGLQTMELGNLLSRGFLANGTPDMYTDQLKCAVAPEVPVTSDEGYAVTVTFVKALADFLKQHNWQERVIFHIHDEPDIHAKNEETIEKRKQQYYLAANILRKYLPGVKTIEAVSSPSFKGGIDIWVPGTAGYEAQKKEFDRLIELGEEVWTYVCCGPEGEYLNRFLDFAVIKPRLLFWGCAKYNLSGFLHWGLNQFPEGMNPFEATSCPNDTGIGTSFPCGDSFIVYPGKDGPWIGMRLEAQRRGAEDVELLKLLKRKDEAAFEQIVKKVFISNTQYNDNPDDFEKTYEELLMCLSKK